MARGRATHLDPGLLRFDEPAHVRELHPNDFALDERFAKHPSLRSVLDGILDAHSRKAVRDIDNHQASGRIADVSTSRSRVTVRTRD